MTDGDSMYTLGIDLGTTFSAAAVWRGGHAEISSLGSRAAAIPSVVLLREDASVLTGDAANRRATSEPHRVAREFKRRIGDTTPVLLGGSPYSAEAITARLLKAVVEQVTSAEGGRPDAMVLSHPANWGPYKIDLLAQAVRIADVDVPVSYVTEPEAAAVYYGTQQRVAAGSVVAVYDLGGGTFDAAVLRRTAYGFEVLGEPEGIERLGGVDVDAAVFDHVARALGGKLEELDEDDPAAATAVARLRAECVDAKEALSSDTDVSVPVILPNVTTDVRLTRSELEAMVRPALQDTIDALRRALRSAELEPEDVASVLLVGGASRMPLVSQLVGAEIGRPVAVDAHPKHSVALGAAWLAAVAAGAVAPVVAQGQNSHSGTADTDAPSIPAPRSGKGPGAELSAVAAVAGAMAAVGPTVVAPTPTGGLLPQPPSGSETTAPQGVQRTGEFAVPGPRQESESTQVLPPGGGAPFPAGSAFAGAPSTPPGRSRPDFAPSGAPTERPRNKTRLMLLTAAVVVGVCGVLIGAPQILGKSRTPNVPTAIAPVVATSSVVPTTSTTTIIATPEPSPAAVEAPATHRQTSSPRRKARPVQAPAAPADPPPVVQTQTITKETTVTRTTDPSTPPSAPSDKPVTPSDPTDTPVEPSGEATSS
jgi:molecular chaperone DnaK